MTCDAPKLLRRFLSLTVAMKSLRGRGRDDPKGAVRFGANRLGIEDAADEVALGPIREAEDAQPLVRLDDPCGVALAG